MISETYKEKNDGKIYEVTLFYGWDKNKKYWNIVLLEEYKYKNKVGNLKESTYSKIIDAEYDGDVSPEIFLKNIIKKEIEKCLLQ